MRDLPTGTVTLLFTDIEGSTRLLRELGDEYAGVLADHRRLLRDAFAQHGGVEVDTQGDSFFVAFADADAALAAAASSQTALTRHRWQRCSQSDPASDSACGASADVLSPLNPRRCPSPRWPSVRTAA